MMQQEGLLHVLYDIAYTIPSYSLRMLTVKLQCLYRQRGVNGKANASDTARRVRTRDRAGRAIPAPEANAELQTNLDVCH